MRRVLCLGIWLLCLAGCGPTVNDHARLLNEDGLYLYQRGDFSRARESFQAALALQPRDPALLYNIGQCYDHQGDLLKAEQYYQQCLQIAANHAPCRHALAALLLQTGRRTAAEHMLEDWLIREPKLADAFAENGWLLHQLGDLPQAQARLHQALELDPHQVRALTELAVIYEKMAMPERALVLYERALLHDSHQPEIVQKINQLRARGVGRPHPQS
jgi:Tfp pilus assembly protein PilF